MSAIDSQLQLPASWSDSRPRMDDLARRCFSDCPYDLREALKGFFETSSSSPPLVSVIVPCKNAEKTLRTCLQSVVDQVYPKLEIVVVDDGSRDESMKVLQEMESAHRDCTWKVLRLAESSGGLVAKVRNAGLKVCSGELISFLDADDAWLPWKLLFQVDAMMKSPNVNLSSTGYRRVLDITDSSVSPGALITPLESFTKEDLLKSNTVATSTAMIRGKTFFPEIPNEDLGLWVQILGESSKGLGLQVDAMRYQRSAQSLSGNKWVAAKRMWNFYRNHMGFGFFKSVRYFVQYALFGFFKHARF